MPGVDSRSWGKARGRVTPWSRSNSVASTPVLAPQIGTVSESNTPASTPLLAPATPSSMSVGLAPPSPFLSGQCTPGTVSATPSDRLSGDLGQTPLSSWHDMPASARSGPDLTPLLTERADWEFSAPPSSRSAKTSCASPTLTARERESSSMHPFGSVEWKRGYHAGAGEHHHPDRHVGIGTWCAGLGTRSSEEWIDGWREGWKEGSERWDISTVERMIKAVSEYLGVLRYEDSKARSSQHHLGHAQTSNLLVWDGLVAPGAGLELRRQMDLDARYQADARYQQRPSRHLSPQHNSQLLGQSSSTYGSHQETHNAAIAWSAPGMSLAPRLDENYSNLTTHADGGKSAHSWKDLNPHSIPEGNLLPSRIRQMEAELGCLLEIKNSLRMEHGPQSYPWLLNNCHERETLRIRRELEGHPEASRNMPNPAPLVVGRSTADASTETAFGRGKATSVHSATETPGLGASSATMALEYPSSEPSTPWSSAGRSRASSRAGGSVRSHAPSGHSLLQAIASNQGTPRSSRSARSLLTNQSSRSDRKLRAADMKTLFC